MRRKRCSALLSSRSDQNGGIGLGGRFPVDAGAKESTYSGARGPAVGLCNREGGRER